MKVTRENMENIMEQRLLKQVLPQLLSNAERGVYDTKDIKDRRNTYERDRDWLLE